MQQPLTPGEKDCVMPISRAQEGELCFLGSPFLQHAFAVHDQENNALYMSQHKDCGGQNLIEVPAGVDAAMTIRGEC